MDDPKSRKVKAKGGAVNIIWDDYFNRSHGALDKSLNFSFHVFLLLLSIRVWIPYFCRILDKIFPWKIVVQDALLRKKEFNKASASRQSFSLVSGK